jgi:hypothetical protein
VRTRALFLVLVVSAPLLSAQQLPVPNRGKQLFIAIKDVRLGTSS